MTTHHRWALRLFLVALTVPMGAGIHAASLVSWLPRIKAAYVAATLSGTIASRGIEEAVRQYHHLKVAQDQLGPDDPAAALSLQKLTAPDLLLCARWTMYD